MFKKRQEFLEKNYQVLPRLNGVSNGTTSQMTPNRRNNSQFVGGNAETQDDESQPKHDYQLLNFKPGQQKRSGY